METTYKFNLEQPAQKVGGSYQATGKIKARFAADDGSPRYVFRFDQPAGLLHIFGEKQLDFIKPQDCNHLSSYFSVSGQCLNCGEQIFNK